MPVCKKVNQQWRGLISLCDFHTAQCVHEPLFNYIRQQNGRRTLPWNSRIWQEKQLEREIDAPEQSSSQQLTWVIINVSTDTPFKSPPIDIFDIAQGIVHLLFHASVMVQLAPDTSHPRTPTETHTHAYTSHSSLSVAEMTIDVWVWIWNVLKQRKVAGAVVVGISLDIKQLYPRRAVSWPFHRG